jgi:outer membrane assembly lipoprotein YfiO
MLYRIQSRAPGSSLAEKALLRTADHYYAESDFDFAADAYAAFLRQYPRSPHVPHVRLRRAYASLAQFNGLKFDATAVIDGREQLRAIVVLYPELAEERNVPALLKRIDTVLAQKLLVRADFYRRTRQPQASAYTLKYLLKAYPNSVEASRAEADLGRLPLWAQRQPGPETVGEDLNTMDDSLAPLNPASPVRPTHEQALPPVPGSRGRAY